MEIKLFVLKGTKLSSSPAEVGDHQGNITWKSIDRSKLVDEYKDYVNVGGEKYDDSWRADGPDNTYSVIDQVADAALNQPGVAFGLKLGPEMQTCIIKADKNGQFFKGETTPDNFAAVDAHDQDKKVDAGEADVYPIPAGGGLASTVGLSKSQKEARLFKHLGLTGIVESLVPEDPEPTMPADEDPVDDDQEIPSPLESRRRKVSVTSVVENLLADKHKLTEDEADQIAAALISR